jgi:hypothetical protein
MTEELDTFVRCIRWSYWEKSVCSSKKSDTNALEQIFLVGILKQRGSTLFNEDAFLRFKTTLK